MVVSELLDEHVDLACCFRHARPPVVCAHATERVRGDSARLLTLSNEFFTGANPVRNACEETTTHVWQRFLASRNWRIDQIAARRIEVTVADIESTAESIPPEDGFALAEPGRWDNEFENLLGWEASL